ncbi:hypothetical protein BaRGS_00037065, partial [Batillaria attramentaria]
TRTPKSNGHRDPSRSVDCDVTSPRRHDVSTRLRYLSFSGDHVVQKGRQEFYANQHTHSESGYAWGTMG